nr:MAG TPA: tail collar fiber protein [Caudoviricetes sp.]
MNSQDKLSTKGGVSITVVHSDGSASTYRNHNLITDAGIDFLANSFGNATRLSQMAYIAVGTGTAAAANSDTALGTELLRKSAGVTHTAGTTKVTVEATFSAGEATGALTEAGILNASTGGILFDRIVFPVINKGASDTVTFTFEITLSRG